MAISYQHSERNVSEYQCPIPGCSYTHESVPGIIGHVGHHDDGWDSAERSPGDFHDEATLSDSEQAKRVAALREFFERNDIPTDPFRFYVHQTYDKVNIALEDRLDEDDWTAYRALIENTEGLDYMPQAQVVVVSEEFERKLPAPTSWVMLVPEWSSDQCEVVACDDDASNILHQERGIGRVLCHVHAKEFMGVTS